MIHHRVVQLDKVVAHCGVVIEDPSKQLTDDPRCVTCPRCPVHLQIAPNEPRASCGASIDDPPSQLSIPNVFVTCQRCLAGTFDDPRSRESERIAWQAEMLEKSGQLAEARCLYAIAANLEEKVVENTPPSQPRVRHVLAISAVALWLNAMNHVRATALATKYLADGILTEQDLADMVDVRIKDMLRKDKETR